MFDIQHDNHSMLVVGVMVFLAMGRSLINVICRAEEAGTYLATYKAFEHKPPNMIKERVDKDYHAILRSALTSINKVNKMDVETLRTSLGVSFFGPRNIYGFLICVSPSRTLRAQARNNFEIYLASDR